MRVDLVRFTAMAVSIAVAAIVMSACGSDYLADDYSSTTTDAPKYPPAPTVADLDAELTKGLDPNVPLDQKIGMFQGLQADPGLIDRAGNRIRTTGVTFDVTRVTDHGNGTLTVDVNFITNDNPNSGTVPFIAEDGVWKVEKSWVCNLVKITQTKSPACPE